MNGPYPPVVPPKPPNIEVSHTVDVTSTENPQQRQTSHQHQSQRQAIRHKEAISSEALQQTRQKRSHTRTSAFAESLEQPTSRVKLKLEPRIEPPGSAYRGRIPSQTNPEIGIISFLCEYPRARAQSAEPRKALFQNLLHHSNSERRLLSGTKQKTAAAIATKRTSDGRGYGQIVIKGLYEGGDNKSTYQVNNADGFDKPFARKRSRGKRLEEEMVRSVKKREPVESVNADEESAVMASDQMADSIHRDLNNGQKREDEMQQKRDREKQRRGGSPAPMLPLQNAAESTFGVDFDKILKRHEEATTSPRKAKRGSFNKATMTRSESRPNFRDFAGEGTTSFIRSAFRRRSKSPIKKSLVNEDPAKQTPLKQSPSKNPNKQIDVEAELLKASPISPEVPDLLYTRRINSIHDTKPQYADLGAIVPLIEPAADDRSPPATREPQRQLAMLQGQQSSGHSSNARDLSNSNGHSKSPSGISAGSNENDNLSEVSSAIISDAQSVSIHKPSGSADWGNGNLSRKPLRPGPAPTGPLPSLPEGHDVQLPLTPRRSESNPRKLSPERSPTKSRRKIPAKYKLTPAEESPAKRPPSPARMNAATKPEQITRKPAALVRIQTANLNTFPLPPMPSPERTKGQAIDTAFSEKLPTSMSDGTLGARAEHTKRLKVKDLVRERSQTATNFDHSQPQMPKMRAMPPTINGGDGHKDSIERLIDSYEQDPDPRHRAQVSLISTFSASTQDNRNSTQSSEFSPIIIVADQEPLTPLKPLSVKTPSSEYTNGCGNPSVETERCYAPISLHDHAGEHLDSRPASEYSLQPPQPPGKSARRSITNRSPHRSIINRAPTPFAHPSLLRRASHRSSQRSSFVEPDLEARMAAMEKKNLLLERAFLAVMDASASISSGDCFQSRDSGHSFGTVDRSNGGANGALDNLSRDSAARDENGDSLYAGLGNLLVRQGSGRLSTLSTSSGPF